MCFSAALAAAKRPAQAAATELEQILSWGIRVEHRFTWIIHFLTSQKTTDALQGA